MRKHIWIILVTIILPIILSWGPLPALISTGGVNTSWSNWDETTESGWGDSDNTFICLFENNNVGGNETGSGLGLSGANLVLTDDNGDTAGATGSPPSRVIDASNDHFSWTQIGIDTSLTAGNWTYIWKYAAVTHPGADKYMCELYSGGEQDQLGFKCKSSGELEMALIENGSTVGSGNTTNTIVTAQDVWVVFSYNDSTSTAKLGFSTTRPTDWNDIAAGDMITDNSCNLDWSGTGWDQADYKHVINGYTDFVGHTVYYFIASKSLLLDNS